MADFSSHEAPAHKAQSLPVMLPGKLIGRDVVLAQVYGQLKANKPILIYGTAGTGKTALAATLASAYTELPGGALWLNVNDSPLEELIVHVGRAYGIDDTVLASASKTLSRLWMETVNSLIPTGVIHAQRRTEEVEMAAEAVQDAGIEPIMTRSTAARLRWKDQLGMKEHFGGVVPPSYKEAVDAIASKIGQVRGGAGS